MSVACASSNPNVALMLAAAHQSRERSSCRAAIVMPHTQDQAAQRLQSAWLVVFQGGLDRDAGCRSVRTEEVAARQWWRIIVRWQGRRWQRKVDP